MGSSIWLIIAVKVPLVALIGLIIWWASRGEPDGAGGSESDEDGGIRRHPRPHPRRPFPRHPRRGPHGAGGGPIPPPSRTRTVRARSRTLGHR